MVLEKKTFCTVADRPKACRGGAAPAPGHGPSGPVPQTVRASAKSTAKRYVPVFGARISANTYMMLSSFFPLLSVPLSHFLT
jgi:hypothetical protein